MKRVKQLAVLLVLILCVAMAVVILLHRIMEDKTAPTIQIKDEGFVYQDGMTDEQLLANAEAKDDRDGDVGESLQIDDVLVSAENQMAVVIYVAKDSANNVAKAEVQYTYNNGASQNISGTPQTTDPVTGQPVVDPAAQQPTTIDPVTGQVVTDPASQQAVTVDPVTGQPIM